MANKPKKIKLKPTESGGQFYQSDKQRKARRDNAKKSATGRYIETDLEKTINKAIEERMLEGKMTPEKAGKFKAQYFIDMMDDTYSNKAKGGAVRAMKNGGAVMKGRGPKFKGQS